MKTSETVCVGDEPDELHENCRFQETGEFYLIYFTLCTFSIFGILFVTLIFINCLKTNAAPVQTIPTVPDIL